MKCTAIAIAIVLLAALVCSVAWSQTSRDIWLGGYFLLRIRTAAGGFSIDQRVTEIQQRANDLLRLDGGISNFTVRKSGYDANIYADDQLFMTVTAADARANGTTVEALARFWAQRLKTIYPGAKARRPGVGTAS